VTGLDRYINNFITNLKDGRQSIRFPECPRCNKKIRHCQRYISFTNRIQSWIKQIKIKQQNGLTSTKLNEQRDELTKTLKDSFDRIKLFDETILNTLIRRFDNKKHVINVDELNYLKNTCEFFREIKYEI
jgi:uncharacterized C2H2 Zn-finger protein